MVRIDQTLDARNLICPMPVIRTQQKVETLDAGQILEVHCTDPGALVDIPAWCRVHGHQVLFAETLNNESIVRLQVCR
ncbi:MAG: sulfurtransferase TusA family protein [Acidiferrobacterales bacterium]|nr:sulfurtransferase TusA family protein [Acidiferrobacterales bacterium]